MTIHPLRDFQNSWRELLAMFDRLESADRLFDWQTPDDYKPSLSTKSIPMASLVRELHSVFGDRTVAGASLLGVVLSVTQTISQQNNHLITLRIAPDKRVQVGLLGHGPHGLRPNYVDRVICSHEEVNDQIESFLTVLVAEAGS